MNKDPFALERRLYHMNKKYADEKLEEAKKYALMQIDAIPEPEKVVIPELDAEAIAVEVMALLPKQKKLKDKKKATKGIAVVTPEDVMAMIMGSIEKVNQEVKTGDTIVINEAPQRVMETVREIIRETGGDVNYEEIYNQLDRRLMEWRGTLPAMSGGASALSMMTDVRLDGVPQDAQGNYLLGQIGGEAAEAFEKVSKNLKSYPYILNYTGEDLTSLVYDLGSGQSVTKNLAYSGGNLISITLSGDTPAGIDLIKTLVYTGDNLTSINYS